MPHGKGTIINLVPICRRHARSEAERAEQVRESRSCLFQSCSISADAFKADKRRPVCISAPIRLKFALQSGWALG